MTDTNSENLRVWGINEETSVLALAAFDYLKAGQTIFGLDDGWQHLREVRDDRLAAVVAFLRSDEPMPDAMRIALADALDPAIDSPVKLKPIMKKQASSVTLLNRIRKAPALLAKYDQYRSDKINREDALAKASADLGVNQSDAARICLCRL